MHFATYQLLTPKGLFIIRIGSRLLKHISLLVVTVYSKVVSSRHSKHIQIDIEESDIIHGVYMVCTCGAEMVLKDYKAIFI